MCASLVELVAHGALVLPSTQTRMDVLMPRIEDHPLVLARLRAGVSRVDLAGMLGVNRSTIAAIEEGRTQAPSEATLLHLDRALHLRPGTLTSEMSRWHAERNGHVVKLTLEARAILSRGPEEVRRYVSFRAWREKIAPTSAAFASLLGMNHTTVSRYENGVRVNGMPDSLAHALMSKLEMGPDYMVALKKLPPS